MKDWIARWTVQHTGDISSVHVMPVMAKSREDARIVTTHYPPLDFRGPSVLGYQIDIMPREAVKPFTHLSA